MKIHRFFGKFVIVDKGIMIGEKEMVHQIKNVLHLKIGEKILLCDENKNEYMVEITRIEKKVDTKIISSGKNKNESKRDVHLYLSILKKENFELAVQKAVEVGVNTITPLITDRTVKLDIKRERILKIIKEAAEQSERGIIPELKEIANFSDVIKEKRNGITFFCDRSGNNLYDLMKKTEEENVINVFIGPEGGWSENELEYAKENKFLIANLGKFTLRGETAAIIASYLFSNS
ncbi:MAG: RsmE family RNA methyltransferase [Patescibacteria group bacterium]